MAPKLTPVVWHPPLSRWIKANTDGMSKGNPSILAFARVFRDSLNDFCGAFVMPLDFHNYFLQSCMLFFMLTNILAFSLV